MKLNKKGFLLAETIVTVCIIATLATSMYIYISKTAFRFEDRNNYENVVDVYKANTLKKYLIEKNYETVSNSPISETDLGILNDEENLNIKETYLINNTQTAKDDLKNNITNQALKDYINWISINGSDSDLRLIVWFNGKNGEDGTFANLVISK